MGFDTTVCVRSILLRGFDEDCSAFIGEHMKRRQVQDGRLDDGKIRVIYDTVLSS